MGFLDNIRDRFRKDDDYYDDDYYEDDYYDDNDTPRDRGYNQPRPTGSATKLLGNTSRPEAQSVSVYTRSGRPVSQGTSGYGGGVQSTQQQRRSTTQDWSSQDYDNDEDYRSSSYDTSYSASESSTASATRVPSAQLPAYVLRPVSYDDVQSVVRRVRTNQPVVLVFKGTNIDTAKRILDFCYGLSFGIGGEVQALGDRVFAVLPAGIELSQTDLDKLVDDGDLAR